MTSLKLDTIASMRSNPQAVLRLTALWAVVESGLGGILHAFQIPLTGLVIGGTAVILITLIAHFAEKSREILRATIIVLIIKALVSPHSPIGAYVAVGFQGVAGWMIYSIARPGYVSSLPFAMIALVESAIQKLLMLVLFFGKPLWTAVDNWGMWVLKNYFPSHADEGLSLSWTLVLGYVSVYVIGGIFVGIIAARIPKQIETLLLDLLAKPNDLRPVLNLDQEALIANKKGKRKRQRFLWWIGIAVVLGASIYFGNTSTNPATSALLYLVRTLAIVAVWYFLVGPWLASLFRKWLLGKSSRYANELDEVMEVLPQLKQMAKQEYAWLSTSLSGFGLYRRWLMRVLALSLTIPSRAEHEDPRASAGLSPKPGSNPSLNVE